LKRTILLAPLVASSVATFVFIALSGYSFGGVTQRLPGTSPSSDQVNVLPQVYRQYDSTLFSRDPQMRSGATFATILWPIIGRVCPPASVNWVFFLLHVVSLTASFWLVWRLAAECGGACAGYLAIILFVVMRISPASEPTLDAAFYTRGAALPLGLAAILLVLRSRTLWAGAMLVLAAAIHAITALQVLCVCMPLAILSPTVSPARRWRYVAALVVGGVIVWSGIETVMIPQVLRPGAAWIALQRSVNGGHLFIDLIMQSAWREFAVCAVFLLPALALRSGAVAVSAQEGGAPPFHAAFEPGAVTSQSHCLKQWHTVRAGGQCDPLRRLAGAALIGAALSICLGVAGQLSETSILLQLSPLRGLKLTMILSLVSAAALVARSIERDSAASGARSARVAAIAGGAALMALVCHQHYLAIAAFVVMTLVGDGPRWLRAVSLVAAGAIAAWFVGFDAMHGWESSTKTAWLVTGGVGAGTLIYASVITGAGRVIDLPDRVNARLGLTGMVLASLAALGLLTIPVQRDDVWVYAARDYPWRQPADPWAEGQQWVAANTPVDSLFLVPPWLEGFRTYARRSEFVEYKMGTLSLFHPAFGEEWAGRMALLTPRRFSAEAYEDMAMNYNALTADEIAAVVEKFGITHVVVLASREDLPYRTIYQNALFRVLDTAR